MTFAVVTPYANSGGVPAVRSPIVRPAAHQISRYGLPMVFAAPLSFESITSSVRFKSFVFATAFSASHCRTIGLCNALLTRPQTTRHPALLRERRVVFYYGKDTYFPALGRVYGFLLWADTLLSYFGQGALFLRRGGRVFSASGKAHCFPASGGRHSFNLGGAQGLSRFGRGAFLFWGMAYCFRPRRCAFVYPCAYEGLPRLRNEAPECLLWQSGASGGCMPRRVRRLAGDAEAVGALCAPP